MIVLVIALSFTLLGSMVALAGFAIGYQHGVDDATKGVRHW
jgi:hypothetical protein